jgi:hypothetical protein
VHRLKSRVPDWSIFISAMPFRRPFCWKLVTCSGEGVRPARQSHSLIVLGKELVSICGHVIHCLLTHQNFLRWWPFLRRSGKTRRRSLFGQPRKCVSITSLPRPWWPYMDDSRCSLSFDSWFGFHMGIRNGFDRAIDRVAANINALHRFLLDVFGYGKKKESMPSLLSLDPFDHLPSLLVPSCRNRVSQILKDPSAPDETNRSR